MTPQGRLLAPAALFLAAAVVAAPELVGVFAAIGLMFLAGALIRGLL